MSPHPGTPQASLKSLQIIVAAMILGTLAFAAIAGNIASKQKPLTAQTDDIFLLLAAALTLAAPVTAMIMRRSLISSAAAKQPQFLTPSDAAPDAVLPLYATATIISGALFEGPGFFGLMSVLISSNSLGFLVAAVNVLGLALMFPTRDRLERFASACRGRR